MISAETTSSVAKLPTRPEYYSATPQGAAHVAEVHAYVAQFKAALAKYPEARRFQALRVQYITQRAARICLEGDAEEARFKEAVMLARLQREEDLLPAEARKALL
jgi:hypothetical protein